VRAHTVWQLRLVAVRALAHRRRLKMIVRATPVAPRLRMTTFWVRHV